LVIEPAPVRVVRVIIIFVQQLEGTIGIVPPA